MTEHDPTTDAHRESCAECTALWAELEAISTAARALPVLTPSRDLWSGIAARLDSPRDGRDPSTLMQAGGAARVATRAADRAADRAAQRWFTRPMPRLAAAAALLMMATAAVTWRIATGDGTTGASRDVVATGATGATATESTANAASEAAMANGDARLRQVTNAADFDAMDQEVRVLQSLLNERRALLEPRTVEVLERSMTLIDQAIAESRAALAKDPASQFLAAQLARSYATKLNLLRSTATMPMGT